MSGWYFHEGSEGRACQRDVIRHRVRSKLLRHDGQLRMQNLPESPSAQESIPSDRPPTASQRDAVLRLAIILYGLRRLDGGPDSSTWRLAQTAQETNLGSWKTIDASTQVSSKDASSYTNWCFGQPRRSSHRSATPS